MDTYIPLGMPMRGVSRKVKNYPECRWHYPIGWGHELIKEEKAS